MGTLKKRLIILSAPSGAGKTTLCKRLLGEYPNQLVLSVSSTTRSPRKGERDGSEYFFVSQEEFENKIKENRFAEWATVHGNYYGTSKDFIDQVITEEKFVVLDIDVQGAESLKKAYPEQCLTVFIAPPSFEVLEARLKNRATDSKETIQKRIENAREEMKRAQEFDAIITNDDLETAFQELKGHADKVIHG